MASILERYFQSVGSREELSAASERWEELFAPDAEVLYGGEVAVGEWIAPFHQKLLDRRRRCEYTHSTPVVRDGALTAEWQEVGVDKTGVEYRTGGTVAACVDAEGRIERLRLSVAEHTNRTWRIIRRHSEAFYEADPHRREEKIKAAYTTDVTFVAGDVIHGRMALNEFSGKSQRLAPVVLAQIGEVSQAHEYIMYEWRMVKASGEKAGGWEMQRVDEYEKINYIVLFVNAGEILGPGNSGV